MNSKHPKVSIIVPLYNKEDYVSRCLDSLAKQTLHDIEIIIVDDGSTDKSAVIAQHYVDTDSRFSLISRPNSGPSATVNAGMNMAAGDYVGRMDADDWADEEMYEDLYETAIQGGYASVRCGHIRELAMGPQPRRLTKVDRVATGLTLYQELFGKITVPLMSTATAIYERDTLLSAGLCYDESLNNMEDILFNAQFYALDMPVYLSSKNYYHYRETAGSLSQAYNAQLAAAVDKLCKKIALLEASNENVKRLRPAFLHYASWAFMLSLIQELENPVRPTKAVIEQNLRLHIEQTNMIDIFEEAKVRGVLPSVVLPALVTIKNNAWGWLRKILVILTIMRTVRNALFR